MHRNTLLKQGLATLRSYSIAATAMLAGFSGFSQAQELIWSEEFDSGSQPNPDVWSYDIGTGQDGWGNQELQTYTNSEQNVRIEDGKLIITAMETKAGEEVTGFTSARIKTQDKLNIKFGKIEARIRVPDLERGLWPAFWLLGSNFAEVSWPASGEIDIMEMGYGDVFGTPGRVNQKVGSHAWWDDDGVWPPAGYGQELETGSDLTQDFHVLTLNWTPSSLTTYIDGQQIWDMDLTGANCNCDEFQKPHFMILNMAVGGGITQMRSIASITAPLPASMQVDWIRIYDNGFTELSGAALGTPDIGPAHSGSWYNSGQSGHGFSMEFAELEGLGPIAAIYWYTYDDMGNPIFLLGNGVPNGNSVEVTFYANTGMVYGDFDATSPPTEEIAGTGVFDFSDRDNATFSYTPNQYMADNFGHFAGIENLPLTKLLGIDAAPQFSTGSE